MSEPGTAGRTPESAAGMSGPAGGVPESAAGNGPESAGGNGSESTGGGGPESAAGMPGPAGRAVHKTCPGCGTPFTLQQILECAEVEPIGMQLEDDDPAWNYYYFNHRCPSCGSTFLIPVTDFAPWIPEPVPGPVLAGTESCERHCTRIDDLSACTAPCRYAPFRRFLLHLRDRKRGRAADESVAPPAGRP